MAFSNRLKGENPKPGDHIYTWRKCYAYAHHGIYVENNMVLHFTAQSKRHTSSGIHFTEQSVKQAQEEPKYTCSHISPPPGSGVPLGVRDGILLSCLDCFLADGKLSRYKYSVSKAFFVAKVRGGTCTMAHSDEDVIVISRANYLFHNGFGKYHLLFNNCENFALYCKTGLMREGSDGWEMVKSGQVSTAFKSFSALGISLVLQASVHHVLPGSFLVPYSIMRLRKDIGARKDVKKVSVEELNTMT